MESLDLTPEQIDGALRAMKEVALANGRFDREERDLLEAAAAALGQPADPDALRPITPAEAARLAGTPLLRERLVQALIITAVIDGAAEPGEIAVVERFARELGVDEPRVRALHDLAAGHTGLLWLRLARRSWARQVFEEVLSEEGPGGVWRIVGPMLGRGIDPALAARYEALRELPAGSVGRTYWEFVRANHFGLPGEKGGLPERGVWHDMSHVLSGYRADPPGEAAITAFIAGYRRDDPFFWIFTDALHFQLAVKMSPYAPVERGLFQPRLVLPALRRGMALQVDLSDHWDFRPVLAEPLAEVRARYGVPPPEPGEVVGPPWG